MPEVYGKLPTKERHEVARLIGKITNHAERLQTTVLMGPGRWGTSMPELGIPVTLSQIKNVSMLCEIAAMHEGLTPDLSLGTHFFNDLVDLEIGYMGASPGRSGSILNTDLLETCPNRFVELLPDHADRTGLIHAIDAEDLEGRWIFLWADMLKQEGVIYLSDVCAVGG